MDTGRCGVIRRSGRHRILSGPLPSARRLLDRPKRGWGLTLELASASFSLTRGIRLEGVTAEASSRTLVLSAEIDSLVAAHELSLRRPLRINTIRLVHPTLTAIVGERPDRPREPLDSTPSPPEHERDSSPEGPDGADIRGLQFDDLGIDLERAVIEVRAPGAGTYPLRATGMDIVLRDVIHDGSAASLVHALVGTGTLRARKLWIGPGSCSRCIERTQSRRWTLPAVRPHVLVRGKTLLPVGSRY